jgi:hypothetical protein
LANNSIGRPMLMRGVAVTAEAVQTLRADTRSKSI